MVVELDMRMDCSTRSRIRRRLLNWYERNRRDLPWRRRGSDGYAQLVAEFMLQQTQVATVVGYYQRFMDRFPTVQDLARSDLDRVLTLWSGLGYYSRARHLHAAARAIVSEHNGVVPRDTAALMKLPGIGRYTAGAIASVTYGTRAPVLDGNVIRVLMRLQALEEDARSPALRRRLWGLAEWLLPEAKCGQFNQALMELGATRCRPKRPECTGCPLRRDCRADALGMTDRIPRTAARAKVQSAEFVVVAVGRGRELFFVQRPLKGLWAGLWELPNEALRPGEPHSRALGRLRKRLPFRCCLRSSPIGVARRRLTHRRMTFYVFAGRLIPSPNGSAHPTSKPRRRVNTAQSNHRDRGVHRASGGLARWLAPADLGRHGISRASRAILELLPHPP